jgi:hypothetical protein
MRKISIATIATSGRAITPNRALAAFFPRLEENEMKVAVRILAHAIVIGPLMLTGVLPAAAGQAAFERDSGGVPIQLAGNDLTADRDTYIQQARNDMHGWEQKLRDFSAKVDAKG